MNILWIMNKYVDGGILSQYYPLFLKMVEEEMGKQGHRIFYIFFSDAMKKRVSAKNNLFYSDYKKQIKNVIQKAEEIEREYRFTFKQEYFPDLIQVSRFQDFRQIHLKENEFTNLGFLVPRFLYLESIFQKYKIDVAFCDQSPEVEMEFARAICMMKKKIFLRQSDFFLGRCLFYQQFEFSKERIALPVIDKKITFQFGKKFVDDFVKLNPSPYPPMTFLKPNFKDYFLPRLLRFYKYPQFIKLALMQPYLWFEEHILKASIIKKFDKNKPYLFFGLHLPTEATVTLRSLPYMTQTSLIESISRVLPYGHFLYVREHPRWRKHFPYSMLKKLSQLPSVRVISPQVPIHQILKNCRGVITYNSTTGVEALMYGKPVLSFAANIYHGLHSAADYCDNLYELGEKLVTLINRTVQKDETYKYVGQLFRSSSLISIYAGTFYSEKDCAQKAPVFTQEFLAAIKYCKDNPRKENYATDKSRI